jgi:hypothetical protein
MLLSSTSILLLLFSRPKFHFLEKLVVYFLLQSPPPPQLQPQCSVLSRSISLDPIPDSGNSQYTCGESTLVINIPQKLISFKWYSQSSIPSPKYSLTPIPAVSFKNHRNFASLDSIALAIEDLGDRKT